MEKEIKYLIILLTYISISIAADGKIGGVTYFNYTNAEEKSAFNFQRQYFSYGIDISDEVKFKVVFDVGRTDEELRQMLKRDAEDERFVFTEPMLEEESREFIRTARTLLEHELLVSAVDARKQADYYWEGNESAREEGVAEELSFVGTRVRILNGSLQMEWFRNRTRPDQGAG